MSIKCYLNLALTLSVTASVTSSALAGDIGLASHYHDRFEGQRTANGETYRKNALTAAHLHLPLGSYARVTAAKNGKSIVVKINDRGPYSKYTIDLSSAAATQLGIFYTNGKVEIEPITKAEAKEWLKANEEKESEAKEDGIDQQPPTITAESELKRARKAAPTGEEKAAPERTGGKHTRRHHGGRAHRHGGKAPRGGHAKVGKREARRAKHIQKHAKSGRGHHRRHR